MFLNSNILRDVTWYLRYWGRSFLRQLKSEEYSIFQKLGYISNIFIDFFPTRRPYSDRRPSNTNSNSTTFHSWTSFFKLSKFFEDWPTDKTPFIDDSRRLKSCSIAYSKTSLIDEDNLWDLSFLSLLHVETPVQGRYTVLTPVSI